jgi:hypothetical protein
MERIEGGLPDWVVQRAFAGVSEPMVSGGVVVERSGERRGEKMEDEAGVGGEER